MTIKDRIKKITSFFKREKVDAKLEDTQDRVYKSKSEIIDSTVLDNANIELEKTKVEKKEIESKTVSQKDRDTLAELNSNAMMNMYNMYKKKGM